MKIILYSLLVFTLLFNISCIKVRLSGESNLKSQENLNLSNGREKSESETDKKWSIGGALSSAASAVKNAAKSAAGAVASAAKSAVNAAGAVADKAAGAVKELFDKDNKEKARKEEQKDEKKKEEDERIKNAEKRDKNAAPRIQKVEYIKKFTELNDFGNGATIFLDRHNINCDIGVIASFKLKKFGAQKFLFEYSCVIPKKCDNKCKDKITELDKKECRTLTTPDNEIGNELGKSTNYLDRHDVKCPPNFALKGFRFERNSPKIRYNYTCCPATLANCKTNKTKETPYGDFSTEGLEKQEVRALEKNSVITGFKLITDYQKKKWNYRVDYCNILG